ncbi:hypothetical protein FB45DRAFT_780421 [Roridomyces roridus]|uniref:Uncharacterized protein n=1 Tax=Roridomyces roridus TaxID=1738132 RepID=A0AAD7FZ90_9AGAR|nr:hypothetical protein FB45DRAFT_780421 [Roridomyces roridus]
MATPLKITTKQVEDATARGMHIFPHKTRGFQELTIPKTKGDLKKMCKEYGLNVTGNICTLTGFLQDFSQRFCNDPVGSTARPNRRSHKGPRQEGNVPKKNKRNAGVELRRAALIDTDRVTERSKDNRTTDEVKGLVNWAKRKIASYPYQPRNAKIVTPSQSYGGTISERLQVIQGQLAALTATGTGMASMLPAYSTAQIAMDEPAFGEEMDFVVYDATTWEAGALDQPGNDGYYHFDADASMSMDSSGTATRPISAPTSPVAPNEPLSMVAARVSPAAVCAPVTFTQPSPSAVSASSSSHTPASSPAAALPSHLRSLKLGNGTSLDIDINNVLKITIPATSFADDIRRLNEMWDDTSPHWKGVSVVVVAGQHISLNHWPNLFKKTSVWSALKSNWTEWKFVVEHYRKGTPEEFWREFTSPSGTRMSYTAICKTLRENRQGDDEETVERIRREYGDSFKTTFTYRCSRTKGEVVMSKASAIVKHYERLKKSS